MYPPPPTFSQARLRLSQFIETKSDGIPPSVRTRRVKNDQGEKVVQSYAVSGRAICDGAEKTIWAIYRMAIRSLEQLRRVPQLNLDDACVSNLPPVATNCQELCRAKTRGMKVSDRTIRNHINAGLKLGIFTKKKFRGTRADFYVWVNPEFLWGTDVESTKAPISAPSQQAPEAGPDGRMSTMFPLNKLLQLSLKEIEIGNVEKLVQHEAPDATSQGNKREEEVKASGKMNTGAAGAALTARTGEEMRAGAGAAQVPSNRPKATLSERQRDMVKECTFTAWRELYTPRGVTFNDAQTRNFMNAVWSGVYAEFPEDWPLSHQVRYHEQVLERIGMAAKYFARHTDQYPPLPYAEFVAGSGYFDAENPKGFIKTQEWWSKQNTNRINRKITEALKSARREWRQHQQGNGPKRVMQRSLLELFRYHEKKFKQWGQNALDRFYYNFQQPASALSKAPVA